MGLAVVGGICQPKYACVIAEFGVTNIFGKPYPSAGFTSVFVLAHEIGHSLGMHHDGYTNDCPKEGFIMSPSRGVIGETIWSKCSADILRNIDTWAYCLFDKPTIVNELDHSKFQDTPGEVWTLKMQCELFLKDPDAEPYNNQEEEICKNTQCRTPHRAGFYFAGPAIEGTLCGEGKWCQGGECVKKSDEIVIEGGWSEWSTDICQSGCVFKSKGYRSRKRTCNHPIPKNTNKGCNGLSYEVHTCDDKKICRNRRKTVEAYTSTKCRQFSHYIKEIDSSGAGLQATHEIDRPWMGCAVFCRRNDGSSYYSPRVELNDIGIDPYFPDGTWCNHDGDNDYYCLQHHCLPENFQYNTNYLRKEDMLIPQNAPPHIISLPENLKKYLSTDSQGNPLLKSLMPDTNLMVPEDAWSTNDYIEII